MNYYFIYLFIRAIFTENLPIKHDKTVKSSSFEIKKNL